MGVRSADLDELVRARRGIFTLNAYEIGSANAEREQSVTKSTSAGHASDGAVAFRGGSGELELEPCVPSGIVRQNDDVSDVRNAIASAHVRAHARRNHCGFVCTGKSHGKVACVRFVIAAKNRWVTGKSRPMKPCPAVCGCGENTMLLSCGRIRCC